ncbi:MAG: type II toxin-antitoxin system RelE/ParE family toxin [Janthinobacterium lividum]
MIKSFSHKGLQKFFKTGSKAGIAPDQAKRLRLQLGALNAATAPEDMAVFNWGFHPLKGDRAEHFAVSVNGNWRLTFKFEGENAILVDYKDYH